MRVKDAKYVTDSDPLLISHVIQSPFLELKILVVNKDYQ